MTARAVAWGAAGTWAGLAVLLGGCRAPAADHRRAAEDFLRSDEMFAAFGLDLIDPVCAEPESTGTGTTFTCTARAAGEDHRFTMRITGRNEVVLQALDPATPAGS